jgi:hypothetical protein
LLLLCFLHTYAWQAAAVSLWCNYAILYTLLRVRNSCSQQAFSWTAARVHDERRRGPARGGMA